MSNGKRVKKEANVYERWFKLTSMICKMIMDGGRDLEKVLEHLQEIVDNAEKFAPDKFALLVDLGTIIVPDNYVHDTCLSMFKERHQGREKKSFYFYNDDFTDTNFPNPSRILKPGDKLHVRAFKQIVPGTTTSEECMAYLVAQGMTVHVGAQGASLVFDQKRDQLPKGKWYSSFDGEKRLWEDADGRHRVPLVCVYSDGDFNFDLGFFEVVWCDLNAFLGFCDLELESSNA